MITLQERANQILNDPDCSELIIVKKDFIKLYENAFVCLLYNKEYKEYVFIDLHYFCWMYEQDYLYVFKKQVWVLHKQQTKKEQTNYRMEQYVFEGFN